MALPNLRCDSETKHGGSRTLLLLLFFSEKRTVRASIVYVWIGMEDVGGRPNTRRVCVRMRCKENIVQVCLLCCDTRPP